MTAVMGCGSAGAGSRSWQVDDVGETKARVVELGTGKARMVDRSTLPPGTQEGDVVVDGRLDPELRARLTREVTEARTRKAVPAPAELDLEGSEDPRLTISREK